jgi:ABC-2 type transport system permease protein
MPDLLVATPPTAAHPGLARPVPRRSAAIGDAVTMAGRCTRLSLRQVDALITSLALPVMLMLLFVYLFGGAIDTGTSASYVNYVVPGVLLLCAGFGASSTAVTVSHDLNGGVVDRFRSMDIGAGTLLVGHVTASVLRNLASTTLVLGTGFAIGFRSEASALDWLAAIGLIVLFIVAISALSAVVGLLTRSPEAANGFSFFLMFLPYPSSAFVPIASMPTWIQGVARHQPITPTIEALRGLLGGSPSGSDVAQALAWCIAILVTSACLAGVLYRRRTD